MQKKKSFTSISLIILHVSNVIEKSYVRNCQKVNVPFLKNKTEIFAPTKNIWYTVPCIYKNKKKSLFKKKKYQACLSSEMVLSSVHRIDRAMQA